MKNMCRYLARKNALSSRCRSEKLGYCVWFQVKIEAEKIAQGTPCIFLFITYTLSARTVPLLVVLL